MLLCYLAGTHGEMKVAGCALCAAVAEVVVDTSTRGLFLATALSSSSPLSFPRPNNAPEQIGSQMDKKDSVHLALLTDAAPAWTDPSGSLVVRQVGAGGDTAIVTVCRPDAGGEKSEDACTDFWDNDCDGLIGEAVQGMKRLQQVARVFCMLGAAAQAGGTCASAQLVWRV